MWHPFKKWAILAARSAFLCIVLSMQLVRHGFCSFTSDIKNSAKLNTLNWDVILYRYLERCTDKNTVPHLETSGLLLRFSVLGVVCKDSDVTGTCTRTWYLTGCRPCWRRWVCPGGRSTTPCSMPTIAAESADAWPASAGTVQHFVSSGSDHFFSYCVPDRDPNEYSWFDSSWSKSESRRHEMGSAGTVEGSVPGPRWFVTLGSGSALAIYVYLEPEP